MKLSKLLGVALTAALLSAPAFAENELTFSIQTDAVIGITSTSTGSGFKTPSGISPAGRVIPKAAYVIPTPLGDNWLVSGATVELDGYVEITPITVKPGVSVTFTPVPFLVFAAGGDLGYGWNLMGMYGSAYYAGADEYNTSMFYKGWAQGTFQFDTGALVPGDWTHVLMQYTYQAYYQGVMGASSSYMWQGGEYAAVAPREYQCAILAYQLPFAVYRVGVMLETDGFYGYAKDISITPLCCVRFSEKDNLNIGLYFKSDAGDPEWYIQRLGLSYTHTF